MSYVPRLQGRAFQSIEEDTWRWELFITIGGDDSEAPPIRMESKNRWITKEDAIADLKKSTVEVSKIIADALETSVTHFIDLKDGRAKSTKEFAGAKT